MKNINIKLSGDSKVYGTTDELAEGLRNKAGNTNPFLNAMIDFLVDFNKKYNSQITFDQVLDIYDGNSNLDLNQSIILCKALLDFIQSNGIEVTFRGKSHVLRYSTLASVNAMLEFNPLSESERQTLETLSITISSFIQKVRNYFRMIIGDTINLQDVDVNDYFMGIPGINGQNDTVNVKINGKESEEVNIKSSSIMISEGLVLEYNIPDKELIHQIAKFDNNLFVIFLNHIYSKIPVTQKSGKKHIDIAKYLFNDYQPNFGQTINKVLTEGQSLREATLKKINIRKLKRLLFDNSVNEIESINIDEIEHANNGEKGVINLSGNILNINSGVELNLESDDKFIKGIVKLSANDAQNLFGYLEDIVKNKYNIKGSATQKLASIIQISPKQNVNVTQKITSIRREPSMIREKFLNNNINISELIKLILLSKPKVDTLSEVNNVLDKDKKSFDFQFKLDEPSEKNNSVSIQVELNGNKNLEGFIFSLNSFISKICEIQDLVGYINPLKTEDFNGLELDTAFFDNVNRVLVESEVLDMYDIIDQDILEDFLHKWHIKTEKKLSKPKNVYIEPGSREELLDFIKVWKNKLFKIVRKETRKSSRKNNQMSDRRSVVGLTEEMFEGVNSLTTDLFSKVKISKFEKVLSKIPRKDVELMISEYLKNRNEQNIS